MVTYGIAIGSKLLSILKQSARLGFARGFCFALKGMCLFWRSQASARESLWILRPKNKYLVVSNGFAASSSSKKRMIYTNSMVFLWFLLLAVQPINSLFVWNRCPTGELGQNKKAVAGSANPGACYMKNDQRLPLGLQIPSEKVLNLPKTPQSTSLEGVWSPRASKEVVN